MTAPEQMTVTDHALEHDMGRLLLELNHYRHQSEMLKKVNDLYQRMAGLLDLPTMIETYSIWLAEHVPHELIGYNNRDRERMHMFCSSHGPKRKRIIEVAQELLTAPADTDFSAQRIDDLFSCTWTFEARESCGILLLLRQDIPLSPEDIELINESLTVMADPLNRALDYEEIFAQARRDALTGLPNRFVFEERIGCMIEQASRHAHPLTLAALDLDHFKEVNDTMGHLVGDEVLKKVAAALQREIRLTDLLVRMGGDEFLLVLPDTDRTSARNLCERLCRAVAELDIRVEGAKLGVSIGLAQWQPDMSREQWLEQADDILYQAKKNGRSRVEVH